MRRTIGYIGGALLFLLVACNDDATNAVVESNYGEAAGGATTVYISTSQAFAMPAANLSAEQIDLHLAGDVAFEASFVSSPSPKNGGLGPVFNNNSCNSCHPSDGRATVPKDVNEMSGFFLRVSIPGENIHGGPLAVPGFGTQLQHQSLYGVEPEALLSRTYDYKDIELADGEVVTLQIPTYGIENSYIGIPADVMISPRIGMPVFGLGLLEAIAESDILANADPDDTDGDGISGKPNYVWDPVSKTKMLGRFGWKAGAPTVLAQSAGAYSADMGLTTYLHPIPASYGQTNGDTTISEIEVSNSELEKVTFYCQTLGVPAARNSNDNKVIKGRKVFERINCHGCHTASFTTGTYGSIPELSNQRIYPYTDMLLHDMGDALADNRPEFSGQRKRVEDQTVVGHWLNGYYQRENTFSAPMEGRVISPKQLYGTVVRRRHRAINLSRCQLPIEKLY